MKTVLAIEVSSGKCKLQPHNPAPAGNAPISPQRSMSLNLFLGLQFNQSIVKEQRFEASKEANGAQITSAKLSARTRCQLLSASTRRLAGAVSISRARIVVHWPIFYAQ